MARNEHLLSPGVDPAIVTEMQQDVKRLNTITDRFSKIGSQPTLTNENINEVLTESIEYLKRRTSKNVNIELNFRCETIYANLSRPLLNGLSKTSLKCCRCHGR